MPFGEYELSPSLIGLSLLHSAHPEAFQRLLVRTPSRVTGTSSWPSVDHLVSRLPPLTVRPIQARFHCGYVPHGTQPRQ